jgi:GAF domain-containing protein
MFAVPIAIAVVSAPRAEKARTAWLLLPVPLGFAVFTILIFVEATTTSYVLNLGSYVVGNMLSLLTYAAVTYAVLRRRVLDTQFVIGRALVFGTISTLVVASFVLLEWLLGHVLEDVSHTAGLAANVCLALALGLSMRFIHRFVEKFVDVLFFRKRYENERALREFAKDAAFVTTRDALFDHAISKLRNHTDARGAALLVDGNGAYVATRWFGESEPAMTSENDEAILALKSNHKPIDPHRYDSAIAGDLVLPMLVRGQLVGAVVCGPRSRGEAYAPDEVEALSEFAHGVGSAFDSIQRSDGQHRRDDAIAEELRALRAPPSRSATSTETKG